MDLMLKSRVAVITGPAKGMGAAISRAFASEGCALALIGRDVAAIEPVAKEVLALGARVLVLPCDITDGARCESVAQEIIKNFGRIDNSGQCRWRFRAHWQDGVGNDGRRVR